MSASKLWIKTLEERGWTTQWTPPYLNIQIEDFRGRVHNLRLEEKVWSVSDPFWIQAFINGLQAGLWAPPQREACEDSFAQCAGRLLMRIEGQGFLEGFALSQQPTPLYRPWVPSLIIVYVLELDQGIKILAKDQVQQWGEEESQIFQAARSLLFHRTWQVFQESWKTPTPIQALHFEDGYDPARAMILEDLEWHQSREGLALAVPRHDLLLYVTHPTEEDLQTLQIMAIEEAQGSLALSSKVIQWHRDQWNIKSG